MVVVPAGYLALVLIATHVRGNAKYGFVDVAAAEAALSITGAVLDLVVGLEFEAFVAECGVAYCGFLVGMMEGDIIFVGRALRSSDGVSPPLGSVEVKGSVIVREQ